MRLSLIFAASLLAAGVALAACSSGSPTLPGAQSAAPMGHQSGMHFQVVGLEPAASCPSEYVTCYSITPGKLFKDEWCVVPEGDSGCSTLSPGTWTWTVSKVTKAAKGKKKVPITTSVKPNPGNPTYNYVKALKTVKSTKGKVGYEFEIGACNSSSSCVGPGEVGIIVK